MHGDDDDNSFFPVGANYSSALFFGFRQIFQGCCLFICCLFFSFWIIGFRKYFLNLVGRGTMAKLGFEKDCNNVNDNNSNNNYNGCVFVNGILKVIFVYVVVCCIIRSTQTPPPNCLPYMPPPVFLHPSGFCFFLHF